MFINIIFKQVLVVIFVLRPFLNNYITLNIMFYALINLLNLVPVPFRTKCIHHVHIFNFDTFYGGCNVCLCICVILNGLQSSVIGVK